MRPSMGSVGDAYDNAMCESFFATLECELLWQRRFQTQAEACNAVFEFVEGFYNPRRRHSSIGYLSPIAYERQHREAASVPTHTSLPPCSRPSRTSPAGGPEDGAILDRRYARRPHHSAGRDERMAPPGAGLKNDWKQEDKMRPHQAS